MPGGARGANPRFRLEDPEGGHAHREDGGLRVLRQPELLLRPPEAERGDVPREGFGRLLEHLPRRGVRLVQLLPHPGELRRLSGKQQRDRHRSPYILNSAEPHVSPAPNATSSTRSPERNRPCAFASERAMGTEAAEVFPYRSRLTNTRSGATPSRFPTALTIRRFAWCGMNSATSSIPYPFWARAFWATSAILVTACLNVSFPDIRM